MTESNQPISNFDIERATVSSEEMQRALRLAAQGFAEAGKHLSEAMITAFENNPGKSKFLDKKPEDLPQILMK